jgi:hypothetical protein
MTEGEFLFCFPAYIIKRSDGKVFGYQSGAVNGLPIYTDIEAATEVVEKGKDLKFLAFAGKAELLVYLRGLTGNVNHVVLDPMDGKLAGFVPLDVFIKTLDAAEMA